MNQKHKIKLGYEVGTGEEIFIEPSHLIVTGLTQKAGKTTTLESLINRSGKKAIVFRTKIGEKSFLHGTIIPPFFKDRSDWQFIQGLMEATIKERMRTFERAKIIQICKKTGGNSLLEFKKKVDERLLEKINNFEKDILTNIQAYLEIVLPKLQSINFSNSLELVEGLNIIDLERFSRDSEVQSLIIRSVLEEVLYKFKNVIIVIPEAWKFIPQDRGNPCKLMVEEFIRQGATNGNFIWIDSQDMSGVDKTPLKQITEWILGYQSEKNEVKHTLEQIPLPKALKPKEDQIMSLGTGIFYLATRESTIKVYIQPFWLDDERSKRVAMGELNVDELDAPETISPFKIALQPTGSSIQTLDFKETSRRFNKELTEMSQDFFNKIADVQEQINKVYAEVYTLKTKEITLDEDTIVRKVLQKMPMSNGINTGPQLDREALLREVLSRIPASGASTYEVAPIEMLKKGFLKDAKEHILNKINGLDDEQKKIAKFIESQGRGCSLSHIIDKGLLLSATSGGTRDRVSKKTAEMNTSGIVRRDKNATCYPNLMPLIEQYLNPHEAKKEEIEQVYNHIIAEML